MKYKFENYTLDTERRELRCNGIIQSVEPQVLDLLHFLIKNCDRVVSRENILVVSRENIFQAVWGGRIVSDEVLSTRINAARKAIGDDGTQQRLIKATAFASLPLSARPKRKRMPRSSCRLVSSPWL